MTASIPILRRQAGQWLTALACWALGTLAFGATVDVQLGNLHNPYFPDMAPGTGAEASSHIMAPAPSRYFGFVGDVVSVPFTVRSESTGSAKVSAQVLDENGVVAAWPSEKPVGVTLFRALDVRVEGNSNASCSCRSSELPQADGGQMACIRASEVDDSRTPKGCPSSAERKVARASTVRAAPFSIKDPLEPVRDGGAVRLAAGTELFVLDLTVPPAWAGRDLRVNVSVAPAGEAMPRTVTVSLHVTSVKFENFPSMDLSYWISEDPRDLVERPASVPLNGAWGGEWWGAEHWSRLAQAARLQGRMGVTNTLVPLFVRNPAGFNAKALVPTRCVTGGRVDAKALLGDANALDAAVSRWTFNFEFTNFRRWIDTFKAAGFRRFEGAHLFANAGRLPSVLECDLYASASDSQPYARSFRFLPRTPAEASEDARRAREAVYRDRFLPAFLQELAKELEQEHLTGHYFQHVIDENDSSEDAIAAYAQGAKLVHKLLPGVGTTDAINKYSATRYAGMVDLPVVHLILIYDDQDRRKGIRRDVEQSFPGKKYFYNTALRAGGPNRFLDSSPLDSRVHGWLALETGYNGFLYWASNMYRYPTATDYSATKRPSDWTPYLYSQGPRPGGAVEPAYGAGANWLLYPSTSGLLDSLRARRLRDGLLDHWIYMHAWAHCDGPQRDACRSRLVGLRAKLTRDNSTIADFSRNPRDYDEAREAMIGILEH